VESSESHPGLDDWHRHARRLLANDETLLRSVDQELRAHLNELAASGLDEYEAMLIAVRRVALGGGAASDVATSFARANEMDWWIGSTANQLSERKLAPGPAIGACLAAALLITVARLLATAAGATADWTVRNASWLVVPILAGWFVVRQGQTRRLRVQAILPTMVASLGAAFVLNVYPFDPNASSADLAAVHVPGMLWLTLVFAHQDGVAWSAQRVAAFVRFTGGWCTTMLLFAVGGGALVGLAGAVLQPVGVEPDSLAQWVLPAGAAAATIVASWIVETQRGLMESLVPTIARMFTGLFVVMLGVATALYAVRAWGRPFDRELLATFDALLVVVFALLLYSTSAHDGHRMLPIETGAQVTLMCTAVALDALVFVATVGRILDRGLTPNRVAVLGLNVVLLLGLLGGAWAAARRRSDKPLHARLQTWFSAYAVVLASWLVTVVFVLPLAFQFE
jgi:hypothetical protein